MEKKTLVSILAMTSVSMGAYADANVDLIKEAVADWDGATDLGFDFSKNVIVTLSQLSQLSQLSHRMNHT